MVEATVDLVVPTSISSIVPRKMGGNDKALAGDMWSAQIILH